ncbi:MAG: SdrD B-like domain-containing protein [Steroidobacteraceae bacterium]
MRRALSVGALLILAAWHAPPAHASTCAPATTQGTAPSDYQDYCWLDFSAYSDPLAQSAAGQPFTFALPDGSTLSFTLTVSTNKASPALAAVAVPSWSGAAIGHSAFDGIPGKPVLYEPQNGSTVQLALNNIVVTPPAGSGASASYAIIAADGESTNQGESLSFTTNGQAWAQVAKIPFGPQFPTVAGVGTATVTETGVAGMVGSFAFASFNNPTQISATMVGGGLQGAMFAIRYASLAASVQINGARANSSDQFTYSVKSVGGTVIATGTTAGNGPGPYAPAIVPTIASGYPLVVSEVMAPGSVSTLASYAVSLTCTNSSTGASATVLPVNYQGSTYTFPALQYGDGISCLFTNAANRANLSIAKTGPANVNAGGAVSYNIVVANAGPADASGSLIKDPAVPNFTATAVTCSAAAGGAQCPLASQLSVANLQGVGIAIPALPNGGSVTLTVLGTAGNGSGNISNTASVAAPATVINTNAVASSTVATTVIPAADAASTVSFPSTVNAGQTVAGTVLFSNLGLGAANGTTFSITLPANLSVAPTLAALPPGATYVYTAATGVIVFTGMPTTLAPGSALGAITVSYTQPPTGTSVVSATVTTTSIDSNPNNNVAVATIGGVTVADLAAKVAFPSSIDAGQTVSGTIQVVNNGPSTASGTSFTLTLPANLSSPPTLSGLPAGVTYVYTAATGMVAFTGAPTTLAPGSSFGPISVSYTQPASGKSTISIAATATTFDPNLNNNNATVTVAGAPAELMGIVYLDNNQDTVFDAGDTPIAGATVQLLIGTRLIATTTTNASGAYTFTSQVAGSYSVAVAPLPGNLSDTPTPVAVMLGGLTAGVVNFGQIPGSAVGALVLVKTTPLVDISAGQSVPYTITATNAQPTPIVNATVTDLMPAGFRFRAGSGSVNGKKLDPTVSGRLLSWTHLSFAPGEKKTFTLVLTVGAGVVGGEFVNQATAYNGFTNTLISNLASATVRIVADPTFDCPDLIGKVFDDANANGYEDPGEKGIAGVRLVTAQGLLVTTDAEGRYHIVCPVIPDSQSGTNFIVKVDERTLPSGYRLTTDNPETVRLTAGKVSKLNFGATIHHVVRIEVNDAAFQGNELVSSVLDRIDGLVGTLHDHAYIIRLAYEASGETDATVKLRMQALEAAVAAQWKSHDNGYPLRTEQDIVRAAKPGVDPRSTP